jgi:polar amino acid transport system substrate-binding protein
MHRHLAVALALCLAQAEPPKKLVVGTHHLPPFIVKNDDGTWSGISMDVWRKVAEKLKLDYEIRDLSVAELIEGKNPDIDVIVSLNVSAEREALFDLTHAFYSTGLAIAVGHSSSTAWRSMLTRLWSPGVVTLGAAALALVLLSAVAMWLLERKKNPDEFGGREGIVAGVMWSVETVIGYNDPQHRTRLGRAFGILWACLGVLFVSALTAQISSQLTVSAIESSIHGPDDLAHVRVGTVQLSAGWRFCERRGLSCEQYPDAAAAMNALANNEVDALVYEAPILQYLAANQHAGAVDVLPGTFDNHGYAFGLHEGSPLREPINRALLEFAASDAFRGLLSHYLGGLQ